MKFIEKELVSTFTCTTLDNLSQVPIFEKVNGQFLKTFRELCGLTFVGLVFKEVDPSVKQVKQYMLIGVSEAPEDRLPDSDGLYSDEFMDAEEERAATAAWANPQIVIPCTDDETTNRGAFYRICDAYSANYPVHFVMTEQELYNKYTGVDEAA